MVKITKEAALLYNSQGKPGKIEVVPTKPYSTQTDLSLAYQPGYSLSTGQYFDIKIDYVDITEEEFNNRMNNYKQALSEQFAESHRLEEEIMKQLDALRFNANVGSNE